MSIKQSSSELSLLKIPTEVCFSIVLTAVEVYPKECMGCLVVNKRFKKTATVCAAISYQLARRGLTMVESTSHGKLDHLMSDKSKWSMLGDFHSHPYEEEFKATPTEPSKEDLDGIKVGDVELIIKIIEVRKKHKSCKVNMLENGSINVLWGHYECNLLAFVKQRGKMKVGKRGKKIPKYRFVRLELIK